MKRINVIFLISIIGLFVTSCTEMEPSYRLSRGNSVFDSWMIVTKKIQAKQQACLYMNLLLEAESDEERLEISNLCFPNSTIKDLGDNRYGVYKGTSSQLDLLFSTNGQALDSPGAKWSVMFNIDEDYDINIEKKNAITSGLPPGIWRTEAYLEGVYPPNCVLNIENVGDNTWTIKSDESQEYFDIDLSLKEVALEVLGTPGPIETHLGGKGSYSFYNEQNRSVHAHIDFEIADDFIFVDNISASNSGVLDMEVSKPDGTSSFDVGVRFVSYGSYELSYGGATELYYSNIYY